jgi:hypothetical protein
MKKIYLYFLLACMAWRVLPAQNLSTGIDNAGNPLAAFIPDPNWKLVSSPNATADVLVCPSYLPYWQPTPIAGTNAGWVNWGGTIQGNTPGIYVFERDFSIAPSVMSFHTNFRVTYDDILDSLLLVRPDGSRIQLTNVLTVGYFLGNLVNHTESSPQPGTWKIRAQVNFVDGVGGFMLSGDVARCDTLLPLNLQTGLIAYYPFNGGSLLDYSPSGWNLANPTNVPTPTSDRNGFPGCAYEFYGGQADFLTGAMPSGIIGSASAPWSISLWYRPGSNAPGDYELLFGRGTGLNCPDGMGEISLGLYDCRKPVMRFQQTSCWDYSVSSVLPGCGDQITQYLANGWQHLAAVYDPAALPGSQYLIYRDGMVSNNLHGPCGTPYTDAGNLFLGLGYRGSLDDIFFYDYAISAAQVNQLMSLGSSCCSGLLIGTPDAKPMAHLQVYPNPSSGKLTVRLDAGDGMHIAVYDLQGKTLLQRSLPQGQEAALDLSAAAAGMYLVKVSADGQTYCRRLVKE